MKDGKGAFYRKLKLDRETRQLISFYRKVRQKMLAEIRKEKRNER